VSAAHFENDLAARVAAAIQLPCLGRIGERQALIDIDSELCVVGQFGQRAQELT
jgi:hypothetical protein